MEKMSELLKSGTVGVVGLNHLKAMREKMQDKWSSLGFLEGLKGHVKENIAQLYEGEASCLINEKKITIDEKWKFDNF